MLAIPPSEAFISPAIGDPVAEIDDATSLKAWTSFLQEYARGDGPAHPPRPPLTSTLLQRFEKVISSKLQVNYEDAPLYTSTTVTPELARTIRDFYCDNGYLPPPRAPWEERRERCIQEHDLYSDKQHKHIQNVTDILSAFFPEALITFSLFQDRIQTHFALSGPEEVIKGFKLHVGLRIPAEDSLCGHAVLLDRTMLFVPDLEADWRYRRNPFGVAGFKSYVGVPVALELDPLQDDVPMADYMGPRRGRIAIGTINICFTKQKVYELSPGQQLTVDKMTSMLEAQLRSTWEGDHRRRDGRARTELSKYIGETKFVEASRTPGTINHQIYDESRRELMTCDLIKSLAEKVSTIISEADTVDVFDIRAFSDVSKNAQYFDHKRYPLRSLASAKQPVRLTPDAVKSFFASDGQVFDNDKYSGLESCLPSNTKRHLAITLAYGDEPLYLILVTSSSLEYEFTVADVDFVRNLAALLVSVSIQTRFMREDAEKARFLSAISHELRTPMHAVTTSHDLLREAVDDQRHEEFDPLLSLCESTTSTLRNILNDVLDYGKGTAGDQAANRSHFVPDLVRTVVQTVKVAESQYVSESNDVIISVEHDDRDWAVNLDEARFQRVLINGLTNAMKFCPTGSITVTLQAQAEKLLIRIVDTGVGFDESEMSLVFQAFKKLDANSPGAGLGLNITKAMLEKAGGTLTLRSQEGKGTTFEATLPVTWVVPISTEKKAPSIKRRQIRPSDGQCLFDFPTRKRKTSVDVDKAMENLEHYSMSGTTPTKDKPSDTNAINGNSTFEPLRVLIVDDNHICLALLKMSLRKGPIQLDLREANGGSQAVEVFRQFQPDLVLTDVCMPGVDGIAAAEQMREFEEKENLPRSAIYAVTALGDTDLRSKSKGLNGSADLDGWLVKGQDLAHVARDIARRLSSSPNRSPRSSSTPMVASQTA